MSESDQPSASENFEDVLAEYMLRIDQGEHVDREQLLKEYPEAADQLREYLDDLDTINRAFGETDDDPKPTASIAIADLPRRFGSYVLLEKLGAGGMGEVYMAEHRRMERAVALKTIHARTISSPEAIERFHREVKMAGKLTHANVVAAYDAGDVDGVHFLAMEYVDGGNLHSVVQRFGPLAVEQAVDYILQAARALEYAHQNQVIHRDVKPANLLLDREGTVKLLDLGLARLDTPLSSDGTTGSEGLTRSGQIMGTIDYMSPEQALDTKRAGEPADIYSLGCTLFFLLTGRILYPAETQMEKIIAHREQSIPSIRELRNGVPESVDGVLRQMVAKSPEDRQASMTDLIAQLEECLPDERRQSGPWPYPSVDVGEVSHAVSAVCSEVATRTKADDSSLGAPSDVESTLDWTASGQPQVRPKGKGPILVGGLVAVAALGAIALTVVFRIEMPDGTLELTVSEPGAKVRILDPKGSIEVEQDGGKGPIRITVDPGKHRLEVEKDGFKLYTEHFTIESGGTKQLEARLVATESDLATDATRRMVPERSLPPPAVTLVPSSPVEPGPPKGSPTLVHQLDASKWRWSEPINLGPTVNSEFDDDCVRLTEDLLHMVFASTRPDGFGKEDLWTCSRWSIHEPFGEAIHLGTSINSEHAESTCALSGDGLELLIGREIISEEDHRVEWWNTRRTAIDQPFGPVERFEFTGVAHGKKVFSACFSRSDCLLVTQIVGEGRPHNRFWLASRNSSDVPFSPPVQTGISGFICPTITSNGLTLLFQGNRKNGLGWDIWTSHREGTQRPFGPEVRLGVPVNSESIETFPWISGDGETIYFSSTRPGGIGGKDVWGCTRLPDDPPTNGNTVLPSSPSHVSTASSLEAPAGLQHEWPGGRAAR